MRLIVLLLLLPVAAFAAEPADSIHISSSAEATSLRATAIAEVWPGGFPVQQPDAVAIGVPSPLSSVPNLASVDKLAVTVGTSTTYPHVYRPTSNNGKLVIVHQGHGGNHDQYGMGDLVRALVDQDCTVIACVMPGGSETSSGSSSSHSGLSLAQHLTAPAVALNHELANWTPSFIGMTGLSGGGWATVVYSGLDSRIGHSVSVAGWLPLYMPESGRDTEQLAIGGLSASYLDLAALASINGHRDIWYTTDQCCFTLAAYNSQPPFENELTNLATVLGGSYEMTWIDQSTHAITENTRTIILSEFGLTVPSVEVVDDKDGGFSKVGAWTAHNSGYAGKLWFSALGTGQDTATFTSALAPGSIEVFATWVQHANRATDAEYLIKDGATVLAVVDVNQQNAPTADATDGGKAFQSLGVFTFSGVPSVTLTDNNTTGYVIADAVLFEGDASPPPPGTWSNFTGTRDEFQALPSSDARFVDGVAQQKDE